MIPLPRLRPAILLADLAFGTVALAHAQMPPMRPWPISTHPRRAFFPTGARGTFRTNPFLRVQPYRYRYGSGTYDPMSGSYVRGQPIPGYGSIVGYLGSRPSSGSGNLNLSSNPFNSLNLSSTPFNTFGTFPNPAATPVYGRRYRPGFGVRNGNVGGPR